VRGEDGQQITKRTQLSAFSTQKQGLPEKRTQSEPIYVAQPPSAVVIHPGPKGRPHSGSWLPTSGSFKKQNKAKIRLGSTDLVEVWRANPFAVAGQSPVIRTYSTDVCLLWVWCYEKSNGNTMYFIDLLE
jgi:hypothetical protein